MKITFLGTCGGRMATMLQVRGTGGWILEMDDEMIHVDPGPGAMVAAKKNDINLKKLTGIMISHAHPDHYTDAEVVLESMTHATHDKRGTLLGNVNSIKGGKDYRPAFSPFHLTLPKKYEVLKPGEKTNIGKIEITATPAKHREEKALGFVFNGSKKIGYTGDGEYYEGQEKYFEGCDYLILNVLRPRGTEWPQHMNVTMAKKLISKVKPKVAIIQHFGMLMIKAPPEKERKWLQKETSVKIIAAKDGMKIDL
ncbi:MAG: MBL fold metallo-hydrolase [Candidatus Aenigmarchaeota archaeon]|nr:MBL fold metallo-hydrolase [Candidatus Aenigmarchaeota archaeon]